MDQTGTIDILQRRLIHPAPLSGSKLRILFVCTGNSCRSQMAEGWTRHLGNRWIEAASAGLEAHGKNPRAIAVMREVGVDISHQESTPLTPEMLHAADCVVTVCGHADEHCPAIPPSVRKLHWPLPDPAQAGGTEAEILSVFRATRDDIRLRVQRLIMALVPEHTGN